jgi:hypothetical protein
MRRILALAAIALLATGLYAAAPEADPNKEYWLSPSDGPYLLFVASYRGDDARDLANKLVYELRARYKLHAYLWSKSEEERQAQQKWLDDLHSKYGENQRFKKVRIVDDFAVLVGHWKDMGSARSELDRIKRAPAPESVPKSGIVFAKTKWNKRTMTLADQKFEAAIDKPFSQAFVTRNPLASKEVASKQAAPGKYDPTWVEMNQKEKYSLFKCQKPWTLVVQVYQGAAITQSAPKPNVFDQARPGARQAAMERQLNLLSRASGRDLKSSATEAGKLAEQLRDKGRGFEAYVFHTRDASLVTVGGFRGPSDPDLLRLQKQLANLKVGESQLLAQPVPFEVPRP